MTFLLYAVALSYLFLPLQFALSPFPGVDLAIYRVIAITITLCFVCISLYKKNFFIPRGFVSAFFTAFFMWLLFSLFFSPVPLWTLRKILFFITLFPLFYIITTLLNTYTHALRLILQSIVHGCAMISIISIIQFVSQFFIPLNTLLLTWGQLTPFFLGYTFSESVITYNSWLVHVGSHDFMRAIAFFPDPHVFSFYLGIIMPFALALFFLTKEKKWLVIFCTLLCADLLTFSRGGYIGLLCGALIGILFFWRTLSVQSKKLSLLLLLTCAIIFIIPHNPITQRFTSSFSLTDTSVTHRITLFREALTEIHKRPFLGTGLGAYAYTVNPQVEYRTPIYVHNLFLDITVELGIIGISLFFGLLFAILSIFYTQRTRDVSIFAIISISIFLTHSLFDTALFSVHIVPLIVFICALASHYENVSQQ